MKKYKSIDLFAGIGGVRLGFENAFGSNIETVYACEWNEAAQKTYKANFNDNFEIAGDITKVNENDIPDIIERFKNLENEKDRKRTEKSFLVPKQEIVDNDYDLSINKYKETEYIPVEYPPTSEIMANIKELESSIQKELAELEKMLSED